MNQPQALIQGDLALPKLWPFDDVPPPFGSRRRAAQQAMQAAIQRIANPAARNRFPPGVKHILLYKSPPQRVDSHRFDVAMAEAKHYIDLERRNTGLRSSRSDQVCGAAIFVGGSIALAWLLATCAMRDAGVTQELVRKPSAVSTISSQTADPQQRSAKLARRAVGDVQPASAIAVPPIASAVPSTIPVRSAVAAVAQTPSEASDAVLVTPPQANLARGDDSKAMTVPSGPRTEQSPHVSQQPAARAVTYKSHGQAEKAERKPVAAFVTQEHAAKRLELNRTARAANRPSVSQQPEWSGVRRSVEDDSVGQASSWLNWSAQPPRSHVTTRAAVPVDTDWNARMTQRRITDNPDAFQGGRGQK